MRDFSYWSFWRGWEKQAEWNRARRKGNVGVRLQCLFVLWRSGVRPSRSWPECEYTIFQSQSQSQVEPFLTSPTPPNGKQRRTWPFEVLRFRAAGTFVYPGFLSCRNRSTTMESILATEIGRKLQHLSSLRISRSSFMAFRPRPAFWSTLAGLA